MDRGAWWAIVHGASESQTQLNEPVCMRVHTLSLPPTLLPCPSTRRPSLNLNWGASPGCVPTTVRGRAASRLPTFLIAFSHSDPKLCSSFINQEGVLPWFPLPGWLCPRHILSLWHQLGGRPTSNPPMLVCTKNLTLCLLPEQLDHQKLGALHCSVDTCRVTPLNGCLYFFGCSFSASRIALHYHLLSSVIMLS